MREQVAKRDVARVGGFLRRRDNVHERAGPERILVGANGARPIELGQDLAELVPTK